MSGEFITSTFESLIKQDYKDFKVIIFVDPDLDNPTQDAINIDTYIKPFLSDSRFSMFLNKKRLGWSKNIAEILKKVNTPYFAILPHDDLWSPNYLSTLLKILESNPDAVCAYADFFTFGAEINYRKAVSIKQNDGLSLQVLSFLLQNMEAMPWRGLIRSSCLNKTNYFPQDNFQGLFTECEFAFSLFLSGKLIQIPEILYFKKIHPKEVMSCHRERILKQSKSKLFDGLMDHKEKMVLILQKLILINDDIKINSDIYFDALNLAISNRYQEIISKNLDSDQILHLNTIIKKYGACQHVESSGLLAKAYMCLYRHWRFLKEIKQIKIMADNAYSCLPNSSEVNLALAEVLIDEKNYDGALMHIAKSLETAHKTQTLSTQILLNKISLIYAPEN